MSKCDECGKPGMLCIDIETPKGKAHWNGFLHAIDTINYDFKLLFKDWKMIRSLNIEVRVPNGVGPIEMVATFEEKENE